MFIKCYEIGRKRKARKRNLKCCFKGKVVKVKRMKDKFHGLMAMEEKDPAALKRNILHLVLQHPEGIKFGNFAGAFHQLHGFHPQLALHGYRSLKDLVTEMKNFVVLEGDSWNPVIKIADDLDIYQWLEEGEENKWDDSEGEAQSSSDEEAGAKEEAEILELLTSLISTYMTGLRIEKVQEFLLARNKVDLEKFSITQGYKDTLEFLEHQMPELTIKYQENRLKCVVQLTAGTAGVMQPTVSSSSCKTIRTRNSHTVLELLTSLLSAYKTGLRIEKVQEFLLARNKVDLEKFSITQGYKDTLEFLEHQMPELKIKYQENRLKCVVRLTAGKAKVMQPPVPSKKIRTRNSHTVLDPKLLTSLLSTYKTGLRIEKVQEFLLARNRVDLEKFSITQGYKDTLEFLEHRMPELTIKYRENRLKCVVRLTAGKAKVMQPPVPSSSCETIRTRKSHTVLELLTSLLSTYKTGLRIEKVQEFLLARNGVDLEMFSITQGYKDTLEFLELRMPELTIKYRENRLKCVVQLTTGTAGVMQPAVSSSSFKKVLQTGLTISSSCPPSLQQVLPLDSSKTAQNLEHSSEKNRTQNGTEPLPSTNCAVPQFQGLMAVEEGDPDVLKRNVLHLVLQNPKGVKFGDFAGAFHQLHGYRLRLALHGYRSLRDLLSDMQDVLVVEGDSHNSVIKVASGSQLNHWLDDRRTREENGLDDSEGKAQSLSGGEAAGEDAEILELLTSLLISYQNGLRIEKVQEYLLAKNGVDLEKFSITQGYKDTLEFLEHRMPELTIKYRENRLKCVVRLTALTPMEMQPPIYSSSWKKLQGQVAMEEGDPGALKRSVLVLEGGSENPMPEIASESHLYQWLEGVEENGWDDSEKKAQSFSYGEAGREDAGFSVAFVAIRDVLKYHSKGLKVKKLKKVLSQKFGFDLERIRTHLGYEDIVSFLQDMPGLLLRKSNVVHNCVVQLQSGPSSPVPSLDTDFSECYSNTTFQEPMRKESGSCVSTSNSISAAPSLGSKETSIKSENSDQMKVEKKPALEEVLVLLSSLLSSKEYEKGLRLKEVQKLLLMKEGVDLEKFSIAQGHKNSLAFLECHMPELIINYHKDQLSCVLHLGSGHQANGPPPLLSASSSFLQTTKTVEPTNSLPDSEVNSVPPLLDALPLHIQSTNSVPGLLVSHSSTASQFSASPALEGSAKQYKIKPDSVLEKKPASCISTSVQFNTPLSMDSKEFSLKSETSNEKKVEKKPATLEEVLVLLSSLLSSKEYVLGLKLKKVQELLMTKAGVNLEKFSITQGHKDSLAFLECHMPELKIRNQEDRLNCVLQLQSASCISTSTQVSVPQSLDLKPSSIKSETSNQMKVERKPALEEVLVLLSSLLSLPQYKSGLRLKKVQELLLTKEGVDLEKFSIAQGHKDSLAFLECHVPKLKIRNQEDRLNCVLLLKSGDGTESAAPSCDSSIPLMKTIRIVEPEQPIPGFGGIAEPLSNFHDSSANRSWIQSLSTPSATVKSLPVSRDLHGAFSDKSSSQPQSDISDQLSSEHQLHRPPPIEELLSPSNAQLLRRPNLTGPHYSKDQDELKQEVASILARHPEGMSLFQFRAEYSAAYQKNLPLGNASSAKQSLLQIPDVVCLKGYGVQTLLFPVSSKETSLKSGQQIISKMEDAAIVPRHSLSKAVTVADPMVVFQPSPPTVIVRPKPRTMHSWSSAHLSEPGNTDGSVFSQSEMPGASKPRALLQEHGMAKTKSGDPSSQSHLFNAAETAVAPSCSLSKTDPVVVPKSSACQATMAPVPQPCSFPHLYSECFKPVSNKESYLHPETLPQRSPKAATPVEGQAKTKTRSTPLLPSSPVVFPSDWGEMSDNLASKPIHLPKPSASCQSSLTPSISQPLPASFMTWAQPLVFPPMFLSQHNLPPSLARVHNISTPQPQNVKSHFAQTVPQVRPVQPTSPLQSTEQRNYVCAAQGQGVFSQEQMFYRTTVQAQNQAPVFSVDGLPISSPSQNLYGAYASRSQTLYQTEYYRHPWLDDTQCRSMWSTVSAMDNNIMTTSSARAPSQSASNMSHSVCGKPLVTSPSALPSRLPSPINVPQQHSYVSRHIGTHSYALPSSDLGTSSQPFEPQTLSISNRDPQAFKYPQQYAEVRSTISSVATCPASSLTSPVYVPTNTSGQPSFTFHNSTTDYGGSKQMKPLWQTSKEAEKQNNQHVTWGDKQKPHLTQRPTESYSPAFQNSPAPKSPGKCVIL